MDENTGAAIDPSFGVWTLNTESKLEIKTTDLVTLKTTLEVSDFVSDTSTTVVLVIDKLGALAAGTYRAILTLKDAGTRVKVLRYRLRVKAV